MTSKTVTQYRCGFCKKRGLSASHMAKHERHCTLNPNRICRVCGVLEIEQKLIAELKAIFPQHPRAYWETSQSEGPDEFALPSYPHVTNEQLNNFRAVTECPACLMAALRQSNIPVPCAVGFDFKAEMQRIWNDINDAKTEACSQGY